MAKKVVKNVKIDGNKMTCPTCGKSKDVKRGFYLSKDPRFELYDDRCYWCKSCLEEMCYDKLGIPNRDKFREVLRDYLNLPFDQSLYEESLKKQNRVLGYYITQLNTRSGYKGKNLTWEDGQIEIEDKNKSIKSVSMEDTVVITQEDKQSQEDCIKLLGYDPFALEQEKDKAKLYNSLIDYLDESTLADSFKIPVCIQIVTTFNQIDKINQAISIYTADPNIIIKEASSIKTLMDSKKNMLSSILSMAKDNGISINYNNNKSKGSGTLNGIVKKLDEIGLEASEVNLFNLETCEAMKQIGDISNKSILDQLVLDENDYTDMIAQQRVMIDKMDKKNMELQEENRLLKIKIKGLENN